MAVVLREVGGAGAPLAGGYMACDILGSWADVAAGLGLDGPVSSTELDALVAYYRSQGRTAKIQLHAFMDPTLRAGLTARGFVRDDLEEVWARSTRAVEPADALPGLQFRRVDPSEPAAVEAFVASQGIGFYAPGSPPAGSLPIAARVARCPRARIYLLVLDGQIVGSGGLEVYDRSAVLIAGCVHPSARRQGIQAAFIRHRIALARAEADYVLIGSTPGGPSARNAQRAGFELAYHLETWRQVDART